MQCQKVRIEEGVQDGGIMQRIKKTKQKPVKGEVEDQSENHRQENTDQSTTPSLTAAGQNQRGKHWEHPLFCTEHNQPYSRRSKQKAQKEKPRRLRVLLQGSACLCVSGICCLLEL